MSRMIRKGMSFRSNMFVGSALIHMYAKCGALLRAHNAFDKLPIRNVISWTALIAGYCRHGNVGKALGCFELMQHEGVSPNEITFSCILQACGNMGIIAKGQEVHTHIEREGMLGKWCMLDTALVDMYVKCGELAKAKQVLDQLPDRDVVTWTALIAGYAQHGSGKEVFHYLDQMQYEGLCPNEVTFACILQACGNIRALKKGMEVHAAIMKRGSFRSNNLLGTALMDMYAKCGNIARAQAAFEDLAFQDVVSWTALIGGYAQCRQGKEAIICFQRMQLESLTPNSMTFIYVLKACGNTQSTKKGKEIHVGIIRRQENSIFGSALVDMYARCGELVMAQNVFDKLHEHDIVSWTALISGYVGLGYAEKAFRCFEQMQLEGVSPNDVTFACILKACAILGNISQARRLYSHIKRKGLLENDSVGIGLVDMYAKCGSLWRAQTMFDKLRFRNVVSWNAIISGYGQCGEHDMVVGLFNKLIEKGIVPNQVTFNIVLNVCSHSGLLDTGQLYFHIMSSFYGLMPTLEHYTCMVDLFARAGFFDKALTIIHKMPKIPDYFPVWTALLGACQKWGHVMLGKVAFRNALGFDEKNGALYAGMRNIYMLTAT